MSTPPAPQLEPSEPSNLSLKQKAGDATNRWLARNRNLVLRQTPVWAQSMAGLLVALGTLAVVGGFLFRIDEVVTVQGQLESIGGTVEVKTPAGGRLAQVLFKDGDLVKQGQLLVKFDTRQAADEKATLTRLIALEQKELASRLETIASQQETLRGREQVLQQKLRTKTTITTELQKLVSQGGFQKMQLLEQQDQVFELRKQLSEVKEQQGQLRLQADQTRLETRKSIDQMRNRLKQAELQLQYQNVLAPVSGVVFDPQARKEGVLQAGERILSLVPQAGLYAEVFVPNKDIGFVKTGQQAKVRVDAFPFSRYGELSGKVIQIGADALPPDQAMNFYRFPVKLKLDRSYLDSQGVKIPLQSGMAITTNLKLREKRVISLISDLLVDQTDSVKSIRQ
jgi:hemolysin D